MPVAVSLYNFKVTQCVDINNVAVIFMSLDDVILSADGAAKMIALTDLNSIQKTNFFFFNT